jgi:hypothetical protein
VQSLVAFPTTIRVGDSAIVVCTATDADGDTVVYDWTSYCPLRKKGQSPYGGPTIYSRGRALIVYADSCSGSPLDTSWVSCDVRDLRGGGAYAGRVSIIVRK